MLTLLAFIATIGVLVTVHEWGHYRMAVACGVPVLRFSVGIGKPLLRWRGLGQDTEFVIAALPLGGYVQMLNERDSEVPEAQRHRAFNRQPLWQRAAIVLAGPLANLVLAVLFFSAVNWWGVQAPQALLATPAAGSLAEQAGLRQGDRVLLAGRADAGVLEPVQSFDELRWLISRAVLSHQDLRLHVEREGGRTRDLLLPLAGLRASNVDAPMLRAIGIAAPLAPPRIGDVQVGSAAEAAGLQPGDIVRSVDGVVMRDSQQLIHAIQAVGSGPAGMAWGGMDETRAQAPSAAHHAAAVQPQQWQITRAGAPLVLTLTPRLRAGAWGPVAETGARIGNSAEYATALVRYGPVHGLLRGAERTWDMSVLTLQVLGRMLQGEASIQNLSGPLTIAQYAGQSASLGVVQFLHFLAIVSLSLGVLNLLPLPVLDGGHLMYYLWEAMTGKPVSEWWLRRLQRFGVVALVMLMSLALFNDLGRWLS